MCPPSSTILLVYMRPPPGEKEPVSAYASKDDGDGSSEGRRLSPLEMSWPVLGEGRSSGCGGGVSGGASVDVCFQQCSSQCLSSLSARLIVMISLSLSLSLLPSVGGFVPFH